LGLDIAAQVRDAVGSDRGVVVRLRQDERALDHGLREERHALCRPWSTGCVRTPCGLDVFGHVVGVEADMRVARLADRRMLRQFAVVIGSPAGPQVADSFDIADSDTTFWRFAASSKTTAGRLNEGLREFLTRAILRQAALSRPKDVASFLASYARDAKARVDASTLPALRDIKSVLGQALGLEFKGDAGDRFFKSTLVQTLFYGIFSAWLLRAERASRDESEFNWHDTAWYLHVPMIRSLFHQIATPTMLGPLGLVPILDAVATALNRVDKDAFFRNFDRGYAVQYFYEPFLSAFDPYLRKELGVWYTPPEIVEYMVGRVDTVLREELGLRDGLASENVYILDPCVGTGSFLVAALRRIELTLRDRGLGALLAERVKEVALARIFGFELLPAPYVVAHLQLGLYLKNIGAPLSDDSQERVNVYLTNSLTGWDADTTPLPRLPFAELEDERDAANQVKREQPILVILGNPPYNGYAGVSPEEEGGLLDAYKNDLPRWGINKHSLDDPYVRFFRVAERRIAGRPPFRGIVCYISNYSWVHHRSHVLVRQSLLRSFDAFWIDNLHGNRHISEYGPDGRTSETIFSALQTFVWVGERSSLPR